MSYNNETMQQRDAFISHASEDKDTFANPLARCELIDDGYSVWLDEFEIVTGDSLRVKIDEGLACSRFGVVILSRHFVAQHKVSARRIGWANSDRRRQWN